MMQPTVLRCRASARLGTSLSRLCTSTPTNTQLFDALRLRDSESTRNDDSPAAASNAATAMCVGAQPQPPGISHIVAVDGVPPPGAFSRATVHNGLVYVSGTGASNDTATGAVVAGSAFDETRGALENVAAILRAARSSPERIVVATMLLTDKDDYAECNRGYVQFFAERGLEERLPARTSALWAVPTTAKVAFSVVATVGG